MKVGRINVTPVKGLGLQHPEEVELTARGVETNRRLYLISGWRLFNGKDHGPLVRIAPEINDGRLRLDFPDGRVLDDEVELGEAVSTNFWGRQVAGRLVVGPWSDALSDYAGASVQLVRTDEPGDRHRRACRHARLACVVRASWARAPPKSTRGASGCCSTSTAARRTRKTRGDRVRIGEAIVRIAGPVPRCAVTTQDPASGVPTLDTLRGLKAYRGLRDGKIDFGVYFDVEEPGRVRVGDAVEPL